MIVRNSRATVRKSKKDKIIIVKVVMSDTVLTRIEGSVFVVSINRPEARNAVDGKTAAALFAAFEQFERDDRCKVAVLCGVGDTFCAGADLKALDNPTLPVEMSRVGPMGCSRMLLSKPVVAAIEGHAVAGGLELACWADLRVCSRNAVFGVFCRRWGVPLIDGGTVRLQRIIGQGRALDMILTGRAVGAEEAFAWGLANRLVEPGKALKEAIALATQISQFPFETVKADRMSTHLANGQTTESALSTEFILGKQTLLVGAEGASKFAQGEGRKGSWKNSKL